VQTSPLICLIGTILVIFMRIRGSDAWDPCEFVLDPSFAPLLNDFKKEVDETPCEFDMLVQSRRRLIAISNLRCIIWGKMGSNEP